MDIETFEQFRKLIFQESGIKLLPQKMHLLTARISTRLRELQIKNASEYLNIIETDATGEELIKLIDSISTNTTSFYREPKHFEIFARYLQQIDLADSSQIKIWCAASSSGEEPYTLAITAKEALKGKLADAKILATDICTVVLKKAMRGEYTEEQVAKVPSELKSKYFDYKNNGDYDLWSVNQSLRDMVIYRKFNLSKFPYPLKGPIDFIFCRNVMIYFDRELRQQIISEMIPLLKIGGYLFLSHSENLLGIKHNLDLVAPSVYRRTR